MYELLKKGYFWLNTVDNEGLLFIFKISSLGG